MRRELQLPINGLPQSGEGEIDSPTGTTIQTALAKVKNLFTRFPKSPAGDVSSPRNGSHITEYSVRRQVGIKR